MASAASELFDIDGRRDPLLAEYKQAAALLQGVDWARGLEDLERLANEGSIMSLLLVADAMREGWLYEQDLPGAENWYRVAVKSGSARGVFGLGLTYLRMEKFGDAIETLEQAIARGFPPAYNSLAGIYFRGDGVPPDQHRARTLWRKGALLGHLPARRNLLVQSLQGHYGLSGRLAGWLDILPYAVHFVMVKRRFGATDRLR